MKALKFELSGRTAMFKKPDVNSYAYFTYSNVHKIALLGIIGAILGLGGYNQKNSKFNNKSKNKKNEIDRELKFPEFYNRLKDLKISIYPNGNGYFTKKIQIFNNSVGYASEEKGGNLIVREQWLENPRWSIYLLDDNSIERSLFDKLEDYILNSKCEYIPYLGKNDHLAVISDCSVVELQKSNLNYINSLFINENILIDLYPYDEEQPVFFFKEIAPFRMNEEYNFYEFKEFVMTNLEISNVAELNNVFSVDNISLFFY
jgi:CRISPR-associated protein Cas5h